MASPSDIPPRPERETLPEVLRVVALAPRYDSAGKHDATGAFIPEAHRFLSLHGAEDKVRLFDNTKPPSARRREVCEILEGLPAGSYDLVAFFCHGYPRGLQTGHSIAELGELADDLARILRTGGSVALYACSAGEDLLKATADHLEEGPGGEGGFADSLRDALSRRGKVGGHVDAHVLVAHTTRNPYVRRFYTDGMEGGEGGDWLVAPRSPLWAMWRKALSGTELRFQFPTMSRAEVEAALCA